ncbi:MAG: hypothetical protein WCD86_17600 [Ktedonobacteraceae bacterium]
MLERWKRESDQRITVSFERNQTSTDGRIDDDITDDENEGWSDDLSPNTGVIADSNDKEGADSSLVQSSPHHNRIITPHCYCWVSVNWYNSSNSQ